MDTITVQLAELFQDDHYTPGFAPGVAIGNYCSHFLLRKDFF